MSQLLLLCNSSLSTINTTTGVGLDVLLTFNRLKTLSTDESVICGAVRKSSGLVEVLTFACGCVYIV